MPHHRRKHRSSIGSWLRQLFLPESSYSYPYAYPRYRHHSHHRSHSSNHRSDTKPLEFKVFSTSGESEKLPLFRIKKQEHTHHRRRKHRHHRSSTVFNLPIESGRNQEMPVAENKISKIVKEISRLVPRLVISMAIFMTTYVLVWFIYQVAVMFTASFYAIHCVITYYEVMWTIPNSSALWNDLNIIAITFSGPIISLITGFVSLVVLFSRPRMNPQAKIFLIWLCLIAMAHFFGAFVAGAITWQGFGYVIAWMYMPFVFRLIVSVIFLSLMVYLGWLLVPVMHSTSTSQLGRKEIWLFLLMRFILPWFIGSGLLILLKIPNTIPQHENIFVYDVIILSSLFFALVPTLFIRNRKMPERLAARRSMRRRTLALVTSLTIAIVILFLYRYGLSDGLYVYMKFSIGISSWK